MVKSWHLCYNSKGDQKMKSTWSDFTLRMMVMEKPQRNKTQTLPRCVATGNAARYQICHLVEQLTAFISHFAEC